MIAEDLPPCPKQTDTIPNWCWVGWGLACLFGGILLFTLIFPLMKALP